jgi:hypothetical protein
MNTGNVPASRILGQIENVPVVVAGSVGDVIPHSQPDVMQLEYLYGHDFLPDTCSNI